MSALNHHSRINNFETTGREGAVIEQIDIRGGATTDLSATVRGADIGQSADRGGQITGLPSDIE